MGIEFEQPVENLTMKDLLPMEDVGQEDNYYYYQGSLTQPGNNGTSNSSMSNATDCAESVLWIIYEKTIQISELQLVTLRNLLFTVNEAEDEIDPNKTYTCISNFRPIHALTTKLSYRQSNEMQQPTMTCDPSYQEKDSCAWFTFGCSNISVAMEVFPTCFGGTMQSPINLDEDIAVKVDSAEVLPPSFTGFNTTLSTNPVLRAEGYSLQLDFDVTMFQILQQETTTTATPSTLPSITGGPLMDHR